MNNNYTIMFSKLANMHNEEETNESLGFSSSMSKEAMIELYAPETRYIPPHYVNALRKEAGLGTMLASGVKKGKDLIMSGATKAKDFARSQMGKVQNVTTNADTGRKMLGEGAGLMDKARFYGAKGVGAMANNPYATAAGVGMAGAGAAGFGAGRLTAPKQQQY